MTERDVAEKLAADFVRLAQASGARPNVVLLAGVLYTAGGAQVIGVSRERYLQMCADFYDALGPGVEATEKG